MSHPSVRAGATVIGALALLALLAPWLTAYDPTQIDAGPLLASPSFAHPMGTDHVGRDVWARWLYGARLSLTLGAAVMVLATALGTALGAAAGYLGGAVDRAVVFAVDLLLSLPRIVIVLAVVGVVRVHGAGSLALLALLLAGTSWMGLARVVRAEVQSLVQRDFVQAAVALGLPRWRIVAVHVLPHTFAYLAVFGALAVGHAILAESTLSWLGFGVTPPTPSWGGMVADGAEQIRRAPWLVALPGAGITATVLAFNVLADGLRDVLDPRLRGMVAEGR